MPPTWEMAGKSAGAGPRGMPLNRTRVQGMLLSALKLHHKLNAAEANGVRVSLQRNATLAALL